MFDSQRQICAAVFHSFDDTSASLQQIAELYATVHEDCRANSI